jgi:DNA-binding NarL/FixJ family response regulator
MSEMWLSHAHERSGSHRESSQTTQASSDIEFPDTKTSDHNPIVIVERNAFLRDCLLRSVTEYSEGRAAGCASLSDLAKLGSGSRSTVVLLSTLSLSDEEADAELAQLTDIGPHARSMVLGKNDDLNKVLLALSQGANGYISISSGFDIFVQALRFVGAGGTYVPAQCLLEAKQTPAPIAASEPTVANLFTNRELAVIQAIRKGKPNKVIAYELNLCESTVKVHVRHIMKKLHAKNRTDVAIKSAELAAPPASPVRPEVGEPVFAFLAAANRANSAGTK